MTEQWRGVGRTAVWVAAMRATETARPDRLFDDPLAGVFVAATRSGAAEVPSGVATPPGASEFVAIRTRFYDDYVREACAAGVRQVVILAAGLDSRAFRLDWPDGVRLFELDLPEVFAFKDSVLERHGAVAGCARITVAVDLREDWAESLTSAGFDPAAPTAWLAEGLLQYLSMAENDRLATTVTALSGQDSRLAFDHMTSSAHSRAAVRETSEQVRKMGVTFLSTLDDPVGWLATHGWQATISRIPALGVSYGRPLPEYVDLAASNTTILCTSVRRH